MNSLDLNTALTALQRLGFHPHEQGYRCGLWRLLRRGGWWELSRPASHETSEVGQRGLWKHLPSPGEERQICHWPDDPCLVDPDEAERNGLEEIIEWAWSTAQGQLPEHWAPPTRAQVESWCPAEAYTIRSGHLLRQVELQCEADRWLLATPIPSEWPADLSEQRRTWVRRLAHQVQSNWPMVRMRLEEEHGPLTAEVDLTGAPLMAGPVLVSAGLACLRGAVRSLAGGVELLADTNVVSEALALCLEHDS